jgi:hypothetical protein
MSVLKEPCEIWVANGRVELPGGLLEVLEHESSTMLRRPLEGQIVATYRELNMVPFSLPGIAAELRSMGRCTTRKDNLCLIYPGMRICGEALGKQADGFS